MEFDQSEFTHSTKTFFTMRTVHYNQCLRDVKNLKI